MALVLPRLYAIVDPAHTCGRSLKSVVEDLLSAGVKLIQYRDKRASSRELYETARELGLRVRSAGGIFIVNDRADIALAVNAHGVHLGQDDLPVELARRVLKAGQLIGYSTHNLEQLGMAEKSTADYLAFGPIFATQSKEHPDPVVGLEELRKASQATRKPLVAIGGITAESARAVIEAGADAVAAIRDLIGAPDIRARAREFLKEIP